MGRLKRSSDRLSIFFATDIHGSEICFKKFLGAPDFYEADVVILGGDMTGKMVVPMVETSRGRFEATMAGRPVVVDGVDGARDLENRIRDAGFYPYRTDREELAVLGADHARVDAIFSREMESTLRRWGEFADKKFAGTDRTIYVAPGNDDPLEIDDIIRELPRFHLVEGEVVTLGDRYEMLSSGLSNRTPWDTHREVEEDVLKERIDKLAARIGQVDTAIFNIHVPPFDTSIDIGPDVDYETWDQRTTMGHSMTKPVGSKAVRAAIEEYQPLLGLHGHIHESRGTARIGRTLAINPGSDYGDSILRGAIVLLQGGRVAGHQLTSG